MVDDEPVLALSILLSVAHLVVDGELVEVADFSKERLCQGKAALVGSEATYPWERLC